MLPRGSAFASPDLCEFFAAEGCVCAIRLDANKVLLSGGAHLPTRLVGWPPIQVRRFDADFSHQAGSSNEQRRDVANAERHPGGFYPGAGLDRFQRSSASNLSRPAERVMALDNRRGAATRHNGLRNSLESPRTGSQTAVEEKLFQK